MRRTVLLSLFAFSLVVLGLAILNAQLLALAIPLVLYLAIGLLQAPRRLELEIERHISQERAVPEQPVEVRVTVQNRGSYLPELLIADPLPAGVDVVQGSGWHLLSLGKGQSFSWTYTLSGRRGYHTFDQVHATAREAFGLTRYFQEIPSQGQIFILPEVLTLKQVVIRPRRTRVYSGIIPARLGGPGVEFFGVREYQLGDPPRWINWRASARSDQTIFSNEFEQERVADVGIVLDGRLRSNMLSSKLSTFEYSVLAAATLATAFINQGNRVGLLLYGHYLNWTYPGYGRVQQERILRVLAQAQLGNSQIFSDLDHIPARLFPTSSQIVLISPLLPEDQDILMKLRARDYQLMVVSPDPVRLEQSTLPDQSVVRQAARILAMERELMIQRLRRAGIQVINWDVAVPFDLVVRQHLTRPPAWMKVVEASR